MTNPIKVDAHVHLYRNEEEGRTEKEGYQVWEYGEKTDVHTTECVGTIDELVIQMDVTGISKAVVVNLFSAIATRESALAAGEKNPADVDAWVIEEMMGFNRWSCELARQYEGLVPFVAMWSRRLVISSRWVHARKRFEYPTTKCSTSLTRSSIWSRVSISTASCSDVARKRLAKSFESMRTWADFSRLTNMSRRCVFARAPKVRCAPFLKMSICYFQQRSMPRQKRLPSLILLS